MSKKSNSLLFILVGTLVNLALIVFYVLVLLFVVSRLTHVMGDRAGMLVPVAILGGIVLAMVSYNALSKWAFAKFRLEDKLDPLFRFGPRVPRK
jgi:hypothetical protein